MDHEWIHQVMSHCFKPPRRFLSTKVQHSVFLFFFVFFIFFFENAERDTLPGETHLYRFTVFTHNSDFCLLNGTSFSQRFRKKKKLKTTKGKTWRGYIGTKTRESTLDFDLPFLCRNVDPFDPHLAPAPPKFIYDYDHRAIQHMWPILECHSLSKQDYMVSLLNHLARYIYHWDPVGKDTCLSQNPWGRYIPWESTFVRKNAHTELRSKYWGFSTT